MIKGGPKIINDSLVLCLDAHDIDSYAGEPATNLIPLASGGDGNSRFTTTNAWGTYNTNQYNSNQYFSIGAISSVSNNIVTTSSNHPFRTFDAVRPQTTGGGVSSGTNYFIKKISDTTFSIHAYNSSQNGSQGYIRSDGYHQVHESIATDTRVSINSTSFPTMWHGPPHLPNTCHVKEIVEGGGYAKGTNCMRIHVTRTVGVDGGMAYNVYTPVTQGDTIAVSYWARCSPNLSSRSFTYSTYFGSGNSKFSATRTLTPEWQLITYTWTASVTYNFYQYFYILADSQPYYVDMADLQVEVGKSYSTPYTPPSSPRSATDGWKDLSTNDNDGSLLNGTDTGVSHYRDGQVIMPVANSYLDFDGSDDKVDCGSVTPDTGDFTVEFIYQLTGNGGRGGLFERKASSPYNGFSIGQGGSGNWGFTVSGTSNYSAGSYLNPTWTYPTLNTWYHDVGVYSGGNSVTIYRNGSFVDSTSGTAQGNLSTQGTRTNFLIANRDNVTSLPCKVGLVRVYNKALTAAEVLSNYNATKNRFT